MINTTKKTNNESGTMFRMHHLILVAILACGITNAQADEGLEVSGSLSLAGNTHFISYGADVWGAGSDLDDILFNPSIEITTEIAPGVTGILGTWWDVNDNAESNIGEDYVQEVDVWFGNRRYPALPRVDVRQPVGANYRRNLWFPG